MSVFFGRLVFRVGGNSENERGGRICTYIYTYILHYTSTYTYILHVMVLVKRDGLERNIYSCFLPLVKESRIKSVY